MSFLDELSRAAESPVSVWHQFALRHDASRPDWYLFVEGDLDVPFYVAALRGVVAGDCRIWEFKCKGKRGVTTARGDVRRSHPGCTRCLFFVDKDLQEFLGETLSTGEDLFCTEVYSVENYLVSQEAVDVIWTEIWGVSSSDDRLSLIRKRLADCLKEFYREVIPVMGWIVLARRAGRRPNVNNLNIASIMVFSDGSARLAPGAFEHLRQATSCDFRPKLRDWCRATRQLRVAAPKEVVRGKFEIWFFCQFMKAIHETLRAAGLKPKGAIPSSPDGIALALIGKVRFPRTLQLFLEAAAVRGRGGHACRNAAS